MHRPDPCRRPGRTGGGRSGRPPRRRSPVPRRRWHRARKHVGPLTRPLTGPVRWPFGRPPGRRWYWPDYLRPTVTTDVTSDHDNLTTEIGVAESAHHILCFGGCLDAG